VRGCLTYTGIQNGMEIVYAGDLPARSGLGSSSSFTVGLLNSLYTLQGKMMSKTELALNAIHVEQSVIGEPVGSQDQVMAAHGGLKLITFDKKGIKVQSLPVEAERIALLQNHSMLFYTGVSRYGAEIAKDKIGNMSKRQTELREMHKLVYEAIDILQSGREIGDFGQLLHETWMLKRSLSDKISTLLVEDMYETAMANGALGGKLLGAGGGGFILFFVRPENRSCLKAALRPALHVPFAFETSGSRVLHYEPLDETEPEIEDWNERPEIIARTGSYS
jgi:D-glycero-alpha-D-manno-heptose-7-phosphate kinase